MRPVGWMWMDGWMDGLRCIGVVRLGASVLRDCRFTVQEGDLLVVLSAAGKTRAGRGRRMDGELVAAQATPVW